MEKREKNRKKFESKVIDDDEENDPYEARVLPKPELSNHQLFEHESSELESEQSQPRHSRQLQKLIERQKKIEFEKLKRKRKLKNKRQGRDKNSNWKDGEFGLGIWIKED